MDFGLFMIRVKSAITKVIPIPNIIIAREIGKNTLLIISAVVIIISFNVILIFLPKVSYFFTIVFKANIKLSISLKLLNTANETRMAFKSFS